MPGSSPPTLPSAKQPTTAPRRLGVLVIADEILGGHVHESNSHWLSQQIKPLGIKFARVEICSDDLPDIVASVKRFVYDLDLDYVVTSGGLGPTPDDRTMEGIAKAVGRPLVLLPEREQWMRDRTRIGKERGYFLDERPNDGLLKMCWLPEGAEAMPNDLGTALGAIVTVGPKPTTLFTLPGVPKEFYRMFEQSIRPRLATGRPIHTEELVLFAEESRFFPLLQRLEKAYPDVVLGSYPEDGHIRIRATGDEARAKALIATMRAETTPYHQPQGRFH
jgi:molybdenum cofactor synthesis domain-containing protein